MTTEVSELITRLRMVDETRAGLEAANANLRKVAETAGKAEKGVESLGQGVQATERQFTAAGRSIGAVVRSIDGTATAAAAANRVLRQHADAVEKLRLQHEREGRSAADTAEALRRLDMVRDAGLAKARAAGARIEAQFISQADATRAGADQLGRFGSVSEQVQRAAESMSSRLGVAGVALSAMGAGGAAAAAALGGLGVALTAIARSGDEAVATLGRLQAVTGSAAAARDVYQRLFEASQRTGVAVAEAAGTFSRFQIAAGEIGATREQVLRLVEGLQKVAIVSGASGQEGGAAMQQLGQALAAGKLNGDELRSVMENMPSLAQALAKELGTNIGQLRKMGEEGQLTADRVFPALLKATERMSADFDKLPLTMSRSFDILGAAMLNFTAKLDEALGLSSAIARAAKAAADAVNGARRAVLPTEQERLVSGRDDARSRVELLRQQLANAGDIRGLGIGQLASPQDRTLNVAGLRQQLAAAESEWRGYNERLAEIEKENQQDRFGQFVSAQQKAAEAARTRAEAEFKEAETRTQKLIKLDQDYLKQVQIVDAAERTGAVSADRIAAQRLALADDYYKDRQKILKEMEGEEEKATRRTESGAAREAKARDTVLAKLRTELDGRQRLAAAQGMGTEAQAALNTELEIETRLREAGIPIAGRRTAEEERYAGQIEETVRAIDRLKRAEKEGADARAEAARESERATREIESQSRRVADDVATSIYEGLVERRRGQGVLDWFGNLFKRIAIQAASTQIFLPITTGIIGSIPQLFGIGTAAASGGSSLLSGLGQLTGLSNLLPSGGLGGMFSGLLSTQVIGGAPAGISVAGGGSLAAGAIPGASIGGATLGQLFGGVGAGFGAGMLLNSVLGGNQTGGMVGSGLGAVGGAILGSFVPVIGPLLGGLLGGAAGGGLGGLFGPGESVRGYGLRLQSNAYNPATGGTTDFGTGLLPIDRTFYDEMGAAVFAQAEQQVAATNAYLASRGLRVAGASIIGGNKDGADYSWADAGSVGEGFSRLRFAATDNAELDARLRLRNFQGVEGLAAFVDGFTQVQTLIKSMAGETVPAFTQQLKAINDNFDSVAAQARAYGLAEASLTEARAKALAALEAQRTETLRQSDVALSLRRMAAAGGGMEMDLAQQAENARQELRSFGEQLDALALTAADKAARLVQLEEVQAAERAAIIRRYGEEAAAALRAAGGNIRQYLDRLAAGTEGGQTSAGRLAAAQQAFERDRLLSMAGDRDALGRITGTADTLLGVGRDLYASSPGYQAILQQVTSGLSGLPVVQSYDAAQTAALQAIQTALESGTLNTVILPSGNVVQLAGGAFPQAATDALAAIATNTGNTVGTLLSGFNQSMAVTLNALGVVATVSANGASAIVATLAAAQEQARFYGDVAVAQAGNAYLAANDNAAALGRLAGLQVSYGNATLASLATMASNAVQTGNATLGALAVLATIQANGSAAQVAAQGAGNTIAVDTATAHSALLTAANGHLAAIAASAYASAENARLANRYAAAVAYNTRLLAGAGGILIAGEPAAPATPGLTYGSTPRNPQPVSLQPALGGGLTYGTTPRTGQPGSLDAGPLAPIGTAAAPVMTAYADMETLLARMEAVMRELAAAQMTMQAQATDAVAGEVRALRRPLERVASR